MENRITKEQKNGGTLFKIKAYREESKQKNLTVWLIAWTFCGVAIGSQMFVDENEQLRTMVLVFMGFWTYFEYKVVKAFRWRKSGEEQIWVNDEEVHYGRTVNNRGILKQYRKAAVNSVREIEEESNSFLDAFNASYWVVGGEKLAFTANGKVVPFGLRLSEKEAKKLKSQINALI